MPSGTTYRYWTLKGKVPGPMIRLRQGDMVEVTLRNDARSRMVHSVDFHAALGPGGGAAFSQAIPGRAKTFTFEATTPGLFVYHCGTPMIAEHIANEMYGLIPVEPSRGLSHVDHEYYFMQGEMYTTAAKGKAGLQQFSDAKLMDEDPAAPCADRPRPISNAWQTSNGICAAGHGTPNKYSLGRPAIWGGNSS